MPYKDPERQREQSKRYYAAHREARLAYWAAHREERNAQVRERRAADPDRHRAAAARYRKKNAEALRAKDRSPEVRAKRRANVLMLDGEYVRISRLPDEVKPIALAIKEARKLLKEKATRGNSQAKEQRPADSGRSARRDERHDPAAPG